jgi:SPASM domain peptide maturase of grasp-with-spasm system
MYQLFADIKITEGFRRDLLIDLGREKVHLIPKELTALLKNLSNKTVFTNEEQRTISELLAVEWIFECTNEEKERLLAIPETWDYPGTISNAVIEVGKESLVFFPFLLMELVNNGCFHCQIIIIDHLTNKDFLSILQHLETSDLIGVGLILNYVPEQACEKFINQFLALKIANDDVTVFNCTDENIRANFGKRVSFKNDLYISKACGVICKSHFSVSSTFYNESKNYNTCLNRKVYVSKTGDVKNCPSLPEVFGNVKTKSLKSIVSHYNFQRLGEIKKEEIAVCKDCEFRNICVDCRAFLEVPENIKSKPLKCGYNPYTNEWEEWSKDPKKESAIRFYEL